MIYRLIIISFFLIICTVGTGQISHGGMPSERVSELQVIPLRMAVQPMAFSTQKVDKSKLPLRFANSIYTNLSPKNSGKWEEREDGINIWRLALKSEGAKSLNLIFDKFNLKEQDRLFVYNPQQTHVLGSFTKANNNPSKLFAIAPIAGDEIIIELQTPRSVNAEHEVQINAVNHDYIGIIDVLKRSGDFGESGDCNIDVICEGVNTKEVNRSTCKIIVDGTMLCSGTMLNNTNQDGTPYFLSAAHCFNNPRDAAGNLTAQNIVFYFNFESPNCSPVIEGTDIQTLSGAQLKAYVENMDFALLEMSKVPPSEYRPYWAGWTLETQIQDEVFSIHHPYGDVKKIAISQNKPIEASYNASSPEGVPFLADVHWLIDRWAKGTTEGGSSGSGLFTKEQLLIGLLSGGRAYCGEPIEDYYARFNSAWNKNTEASEQLAFWLDPKGTNVTRLNGFDLNDGTTVRFSLKKKEDGILIMGDNQFNGSWSGHNDRKYEAYANYYYDINKASIKGIYLVSGKSVKNSAQTINVKVWDGATGQPGNVLWSKENISIGSLPLNKEVLIEPDTELNMTKPFFVGVELNYTNSVDTFALYQVDAYDAILDTFNRAYIRDHTGIWNSFEKLYPSGKKGAYWIDLLLKDGDITTDTGNVDITDNYLKIVKNPVRNGELVYKTNIEGLKFVEIYAINGRKLRQIPTSNSNRISVSGLPSGLYLVKFTSPEEAIVKRVVIVQ